MRQQRHPGLALGAGEDASHVANNRIERIRADGGGTGQNGNGINVFRPASVLVPATA